jgi:hypothetical protein
MNQSCLDLGNQNLLTLAIILVQSIRLNHGIQLRTSGQERGDAGQNSKHVGEITQNSERAQVLCVRGEGETGREVEGRAVDEVEDVGECQEGDGEVDCGGVNWMAGLDVLV